MARRSSRRAEEAQALHHDAHLNDPEEWDETSVQQVQPKPSGMVVFSMRLPIDEFELLKREADRRQTTMSEIARTAFRSYLLPRATGSFSMTSIQQVVSVTPAWTGGIADRAEVHVVSTPSPPELAAPDQAD
jgi:hypothetical protein